MPRSVYLLVQLRTRCRTRLITDRLSKRLFKGRMPRIVSLYTKSRHAWDFRTRLPAQASKSVLRSGIVPIGLAASGNLFCIIAFSSFQSLVHESCPKSKKQVTPNPPEGGSKATSEGDWIKVQKKGKRKDVLDNRVSALPVSS
ncbi:hypothetical protein L6452_36109 [Arctium lappa]|uniref:Uncharacterized protein n=1 Tax=Arctium lappa TaxID=4217 RepID=A0ACB8Y8G3_ARCLA|nr:hypothetical protein L6452_36109 [Arctium lappa]